MPAKPIVRIGKPGEPTEPTKKPRRRAGRPTADPKPSTESKSLFQLPDERAEPAVRRDPGNRVVEAHIKEADDNFISNLADGALLDAPTLNISSMVMEQARNLGLGEDRTFELTEEGLGAVADEFGLQGQTRLSFIEDAGNSNSENHLRAKAAQAQRKGLLEEKFAGKGFASALLYRGLPFLLDQISLVGGVKIASATAKLAKGLTKGERVLAGASGVGAQAAAEEAIVAGGDPLRDAQDVLAVGIAGFALGGALHGVLARYATEAGIDPLKVNADAGKVARDANVDAPTRTDAELLDPERLGVETRITEDDVVVELREDFAPTEKAPTAKPAAEPKGPEERVFTEETEAVLGPTLAAAKSADELAEAIRNPKSQLSIPAMRKMAVQLGAKIPRSCK
jgi:hypothetical protein